MAVLSAPHMDRCIGCLLCVLKSGWTRNAVSLEGSPIKIVQHNERFEAEIDSGVVSKPELEQAALACPRNCLRIEME
jgi:ferredoxin